LRESTRMSVHSGRVACCPLVSHIEYASRVLLRSEKDATRLIYVSKKTGQTDGRTDASPKHYAFL